MQAENDHGWSSQRQTRTQGSATGGRWRSRCPEADAQEKAGRLATKRERPGELDEGENKRREPARRRRPNDKATLLTQPPTLPVGAAYSAARAAKPAPPGRTRRPQAPAQVEGPGSSSQAPKLSRRVPTDFPESVLPHLRGGARPRPAKLARTPPPSRSSFQADRGRKGQGSRQARSARSHQDAGLDVRQSETAGRSLPGHEEPNQLPAQTEPHNAAAAKATVARRRPAPPAKAAPAPAPAAAPQPASPGLANPLTGASLPRIDASPQPAPTSRAQAQPNPDAPCGPHIPPRGLSPGKEPPQAAPFSPSQRSKSRQARGRLAGAPKSPSRLNIVSRET